MHLQVEIYSHNRLTYIKVHLITAEKEEEGNPQWKSPFRIGMHFDIPLTNERARAVIVFRFLPSQPV